MAKFELVGSPEPFLLVDLVQGEKIFCESDAMVMIEQNLELA
ncbi:MAG: TIGR00266 family protein, partial [Acinetobacter sp.]